MKLKQLLLGALLAGATTMSAATFDWTPAGVQPSGETSVTQISGFFGAASNVSFYCWGQEGLKTTDVMPMWIDEDDNVITATDGERDFLDPKFSYYFNPDDFEINGEYMLVLPQGLLVNADGEESEEKTLFYTFEVESLNAGMFADFEVLDITPDFSKPQGLWNQQEIIINTNHNAAIGYVNLVVIDLNPEIPEEAYVVTGSTNYAMNRKMGDPSPITWTVENPGSPYKFYEGHTYKAVFTLYNGEAERTPDGIPTQIVERLTYTFTGKVKPYEYSDLILESYTPEKGIVFNELSQCIFTYTFSGPVDLYKITIPNGPAEAISVPKTYITCNEEKTVYTVDLRKDFSIFEDAPGEVYLNIYAKDAEGRELVYYKDEEGNIVRGMGYDDDAHFQFGWFNAIPLPKLSITPAAGAELDALTEVRVKFENGETFSTNLFYGIVQTKSGSILGYLVEPERSIDVQELVITQWKKSLYGQPEPINLTAPGSYVVGFNEGSFIQGEQYTSMVNAPKFNPFTISGTPSDSQATLRPVEVTPANYSYLESFVEAYITFGETVDLINFSGQILNDKGEEVAELVIESVWDEEGATINVFPHDDITTPGTYFMVIPEKTVCNIAYSTSDGEEGIYNPELRYEYVVMGAVSGDNVEMISADPAEGIVTELYTIGVTFNMQVDINSEVDGAVLMDGDGEFMEYLTAEWDFDDPNRLIFSLENPITESGRYFICIPEGYIVCNEDHSISNEYDIYLSYTIMGEMEYGMEVESVNPAEGIVESLQNFSLLFNQYADVFAQGAYIENAAGETIADGYMAYWAEGYEYLENQIIVMFDEAITEAGEYTLVIPAGCVSDWAQTIFNDEIRLHYSILETGVEAITANGAATVYDMQGRVVLRNATAEQISKLAKGIYVIDGKKKAVR